MMIQKRDADCGQEGTRTSNNNTKTTVIAVIAAVVITATVLLFFCVGGGIEYQFNDSSFSIHTSLWKDQTVAYTDIIDFKLREYVDVGKRTNGYGSGKLNLGTFQNSEFSTYQLYSYSFKDYDIDRISQSFIFAQNPGISGLFGHQGIQKSRCRVSCSGFFAFSG